MNPQTTIETQTSIALDVANANGEDFQHLLQDEASVFVGFSTTCGLRLEGKGVEDLHCMLVFANGKLNVRDWHTGSTMLNGRAVSDEAELHSGDEIRIGEHRIVVRTLLGSDCAMPANSENEVAELESIDHVDAVESGPTQSVLPEVEEVKSVESSTHEASPATKSVSDQVAVAEVKTVAGSFSGFDFDPESDLNFQDETDHSSQHSEADLLMEVESLRIDLAQRDAEINELKCSEQVNVIEDDGTTEKLVNRLEDLLDELKGADQRVLELEQLLRLSDEANQAERDEREQLEAWVGEIETRVSQRESESEAERERLQIQLTDSRERLELAELQVNRVLNAKASDSVDESLVSELREKNDLLESRLESLAGEAEELRARAESSDELEEALAEIQRLEQTMLEMEVQTSRERAELARETAELRRAQDELERQMRDSEMSDSDTRLVAMRQHLRERYEQEKAEREARRRRSLGGRISNLLKGSSR